jgi:cobalt-zinc-cadmium efflux system outer membrane protein
MSMKWMGLAALALAACVPAQAELFEPVRVATRQRLGVDAEWRAGGERSARVAARVKELLAKPLTAESAVAIALIGNAELQAEYEELAVAGAHLASASAPPNPSGEARVTRARGATHLELTLVESVTGLASLWAERQAADAGLRAARRHALARTISTAARAWVAFYQAVAAAERVALRAGLAEAAATSAELAERLFAAGNLSELDRAREQAFAAQARLALRQARAELVTARGRVDVALGLSGHEAAGWTSAAELPALPEQPPALARFVDDALAASLDLDELRWRSRAAGHELSRARWRAFLPELGLGLAADHDPGSGWALGPAVTLAVPIFDWGQGERAAAGAGVRRLQHSYEALATRVEAAAHAAGERVLAAHERATSLARDVLPLHDRILAEAVKQYNAMNLGPFELVILRRERIEVELEYIDALADYWSADAEIESLRGGAMLMEGESR